MKISWITFAAPYRDAQGTLTSDLASLRYRVIPAMRALDAAGHSTQIAAITKAASIAQSAALVDSETVVFSKSFSPANETLLTQLRSHGTRCVFDICDNHFDSPKYASHYRFMSAHADLVICNTSRMAETAAPFCNSPPLVIEDPYEGAQGAARAISGQTKLLWFGHPTNLDSLQACLEDLVGYAQSHPLQLTILTQLTPQIEVFANRVNARFAPAFTITAQPWSLDTQWTAIEACDIVIIPSLQSAQKQVKSANRMIEALWAGRPVAAQPLPAYQPFARWTPVRPKISAGLELILARPDETLTLVEEAQSFIRRHYSQDTIGAMWKSALTDPVPKENHEA